MARRVKTRQPTSRLATSSIGLGTVVDTRESSRDCMNESRLRLDCDVDALLGEGEGGCGMLLLDSRSFPLRLFLCRLCLSNTISMLSIWRCGIPPSWGSDLTGVAGGLTSRSEFELVLDKERANDRADPSGLELERKSDPDLDP